MNNALTQYTGLFAANRTAIEAGWSDEANRLRSEALEALERAGRLPHKGDEGFEKTSINDMFAPDYGVNVNRIDLPVDVNASFRCGVPNLSTLMALTVNDRFAATNTLRANLPEGVTVCSLAEATRRFPELTARYLGKAARLDSPGTALNTLLMQDGLFIHIPAGIHLSRPLQVVNITQVPTPMALFRRILLVAEDGAEAAILKCDHTLRDSSQALSSEVIEIFAGRNARLQWYDLEESTPSTSRYSQLYLRQEEGSEASLCGATLTNGTTRNEFDIIHTGEHCRTRLDGMAIGSGKQHIDNCSTILHKAGRGHSSQLFKYVLDEEATGAFGGSITVGHGARFVEAYQSNRNILASTGARMHTKPQLLIYNDDVKCSHGATTGQLDENALFYMQQRGIPRHKARRMLMQAFMLEVVDAIELEPLRDRLRHLVERRFDGEHTNCQDCRLNDDK